IARYNGWIPNLAVYNAYLNHIICLATAQLEAHGAHVPPVEEFRQAIQADSTIYSLDRYSLLFGQVHNFNHMLHLFGLVVAAPPRFMVGGGGGQVSEPIGVPICLVFDLLSNTSAAYDLFRMEEFNQVLRQLLNSWGDYLKTLDSNSTLTGEGDGWFGPAGIQSLEAGLGHISFNQTYVVPNPDAVNRSDNSWDAFFTRGIQPNARPIVPAQPRAIIGNACESTVERITFNVKRHDKFWLKGTMAYSWYDIFDGSNNITQQFSGGTVDLHLAQRHNKCQGYVSGDSPEDSRMPGKGGDVRGSLIRSHPWLTVAATRAIITIQADDDRIGLVAFIGIGMAGVSTCQILVQANQRARPGDELGMFYFGGSSHALFFRRGARINFEHDVQVGRHLWVNRIIA
ncbi:Phophatidylserine decarboxylase-domain-containing protein, partial [Rhizoctonia solani]